MRTVLTIDDAEYRVFAARERDGYRVHVDDRNYRVAYYDSGVAIDGTAHRLLTVVDGDVVHVWLDGVTRTLRYHDAVDHYARHGAGDADDIIEAPMPGTVIAVNVAAGEPVARGDTMLVIESMKLETAVKAPRDGVVGAVHVTVGQSFDRSAPLATLATLAAEA
jgi:acetyl/propionyl-CoA carboxylase alpha subunit